MEILCRIDSDFRILSMLRCPLSRSIRAMKFDRPTNAATAAGGSNARYGRASSYRPRGELKQRPGRPGHLSKEKKESLSEVTLVNDGTDGKKQGQSTGSTGATSCIQYVTYLVLNFHA